MKCYIWSTLLYAAETWTLSVANMKKIQSFELWCYRRILRIPWTARVTNEVMLQRMGCTMELAKLAGRRKLQYFGHIIRAKKLQRALLEAKINGRRARGRPRKSWSTNITEWTGLSYAQSVRAAQDRRQWRAIISSYPVQDGT